MASTSTTRFWLKRGIFVLLSVIIIIGQLIPLDMQPPGWAPPDILLAITLVWVTRRPDLLPVYIIAAIFLLTDLVFQRPPGLWAGLVVVFTEAIRNRTRDFRNMPLVLEWGTLALGIVAITLVNRLILAISMTHLPHFGLTMIQMISTIAIYPLVVLIAHLFFRIRRLAPGEAKLGGPRI